MPTNFPLHPQGGGSLDLRNIGTLPHHYTVSQPEDGGLKLHGRENLKVSHISLVYDFIFLLTILAPWANIFMWLLLTNYLSWALKTHFVHTLQPHSVLKRFTPVHNFITISPNCLPIYALAPM